MLSPFGYRLPVLLDPLGVYSTYLEGADSSGNIIGSPVLFPSLLMWNPEALLSGLDFTVQVDAELDLGSVVTDALNCGLFSVTVFNVANVPAGTMTRIALYELTAMWARAYAGVTSAWKIRHKVTVTNLNPTDTTRVQMIVSGFQEDTVDPNRRPLFNLQTPGI